jgi:uncharacterized Zn finger protein
MNRTPPQQCAACGSIRLVPEVAEDEQQPGQRTPIRWRCADCGTVSTEPDLA